MHHFSARGMMLLMHCGSPPHWQGSRSSHLQETSSNTQGTRLPQAVTKKLAPPTNRYAKPAILTAALNSPMA